MCRRRMWAMAKKKVMQCSLLNPLYSWQRLRLTLPSCLPWRLRCACACHGGGTCACPKTHPKIPAPAPDPAPAPAQHLKHDPGEQLTLMSAVAVVG
jgi:hypothetical protein